jgi:hypothetical protein
LDRFHRWRRRLAAGPVLLLIGAAMTTGAGRASAAGPARVLHFNICGAACNYGVVGRGGPGNDVVEDVRSRIAGFNPGIVTLNEICVGQFNRLKALLAGGAVKMTGVFRAQRNDSRCDNGGGFGDAVFTAGGIDGQKVLALPNPSGGEHRAVLCVRTSVAGGPLLACVLHTVTDNPMKGKQVAAAAKALNGEAGRGAVIVGGDFNTTPGGMRALLEAGQGGRFFDVDPERAGTRGGKIDYILFDRGHFSGPFGGPQGSRYSDHDVLSGQATRH